MAKILVADDDSDIRDVVRYALSRAGYEILEAADGPATLETLRRGTVDLLVLDVMLPGMDGYTLQLELSQNPRTRELPVIVLTAVDSTRSLFAKFPQVRHFVTKPFDPSELARMAEQILSPKR
jgi:CheY-like chemotaxis protein